MMSLMVRGAMLLKKKILPSFQDRDWWNHGRNKNWKWAASSTKWIMNVWRKKNYINDPKKRRKMQKETKCTPGINTFREHLWQIIIVKKNMMMLPLLGFLKAYKTDTTIGSI